MLQHDPFSMQLVSYMACYNFAIDVIYVMYICVVYVIISMNINVLMAADAGPALPKILPQAPGA